MLFKGNETQKETRKNKRQDDMKYLNKKATEQQNTENYEKHSMNATLKKKVNIYRTTFITNVTS